MADSTITVVQETVTATITVTDPSGVERIVTVDKVVPAITIEAGGSPGPAGPRGEKGDAGNPGMDELIYDPGGVRLNCFDLGNLHGNIDGGTFS